MAVILEVSWHDGDAGSVLLALRDERLAMKAANAMAKEYLGDTLQYVAQGRSFTNRNKHQKHIKWRFDGRGAKVYAKARHLVWMEEGTAAHAIAPRDRGGKGRGKRRQRQVLRIKTHGGLLFRKLANHPGTREMPFFFAEASARQTRGIAAARGVIAAKMGRR